MNIAGVVVCTAPENSERVAAKIAELPWADVHARDESGRLIVTIEGEHTGQDIERLSIVSEIEGVSSANMVHYYCEDQTPGTGESAQEALNRSSAEGTAKQRIDLARER
ncbi:MAG: chaperone NapD [Deltaproteobacteria bacterium]|nr:chaperone NapD [Deltaproteobacteria bacterium]